MDNLPLFPAAASAWANRTDELFFALICFSGFITLLIVTLVAVFGIRYRRGTQVRRGPLPSPLRRQVELGWTLSIGFLAIIIFLWAFISDTTYLQPPKNALRIHVLAKQWMWKSEHPEGAREINRLHVPRGRPVMLLLDSRDVIHSFFVPAFRLKQDVVPGRTQRMWFTAEETGTFKLLCAEFCGTDHSAMTGEVVVMDPAAYSRWLAARPADDSLAAEGERLFTAMGCAGCHLANGNRTAPDLHGLFGRRVKLDDGRTVTADARYLRDSVLRPKKEVTAGYKPVMPSFADALDDEEVRAVVAYLQSLAAGSGGAP